MKSDTPNELELLAPLSGPMVPIENVPDPVFAQRMVGDGVSIDPTTNQLLAPCDGTITQVHPSHHAVTFTTSAGLEIMMHIGIDTVALKGKGFKPLVKEGQSIVRGDLLIEFDMDYVARNSKSLLTQIVITNSENLTLDTNSGFVNAGKDRLFTVIGATADTNSKELDTASAINSSPIQLANPAGLHARPAAVLAKKAKSFDSAIEIVCGEKRANAKSTTAIMKMEIGSQATVLIRASGSDAAEAIEALTAEIMSGLGEDVTSTTVDTESKIDTPESSPEPESGDVNKLTGVSASTGIAVGKVYQLRKVVLHVEEYGEEPSIEKQRIEQGVKTAIGQLQGLFEGAESAEAEIFLAHQELLDDPELLDAAVVEINRGKSAAYAWQKTYKNEVDSLAALESTLLAQRANDLRDVGERTLKCILGHEAEALEIPTGSIVIAEDLTPSQTATLDRTKVCGFATVQGGSTSHVAILARAMGLPAIAGIERRALSLENGTSIILDGNTGTAELNVSEAKLSEARQMIETLAKQRAENREHCMEPAITKDGHTINVVANAANLQDVKHGVQFGGEGVGLLRTELLFQSRNQAPTEDEQEQVYRKMLKVHGDTQTLVIRTLDVGGDKPLTYLPIPKEDNPFLGERGIRVSLNRPAIFRTQIRAILRAAEAGPLEIMFPMVTTLSDFTRAKAIVEEERKALELLEVKVGLMIEVPSTALMAESFAEVADFFSVGTNDLAQYTLAIDRGHPKLAAQADGLSPAVLRLIGMAADAMNHADKRISVCGGIAADPQAVALLVGLGVHKLSVSALSIPDIKAQIRTLSMDECRLLAKKALSLKDATEVRELVSSL
ncbi:MULTISPECIES: phosphoenolpyruvate--protein phosphotransferase [unclassified Lentimonas]|uniref:phosphoenolpyruvate--protein phosphotransferase n=1 Tax=unclassified Lentimonas TaxID=2630993 RepID=UPI00132615CF|nr:MULTISPECIES: phosphoenolpyruvate--protein phosphotransferase [unclassified Lentimonas]CAA6691811.1 Phosphoenolpyruvate-protein phosphotransferase of PTS system (EC [Lentimonas sp. CC19]CAA6694559.1 Phosphoenolpyruvate-protein phosphotransferase of PTS system (EC [Lentimonas sp. CC10]CAA7072100.1 Phosphoenolpyruvate-protein phosphotransferase of PTS system (EC [Lentimonas sp. CC11]